MAGNAYVPWALFGLTLLAFLVYVSVSGQAQTSKVAMLEDEEGACEADPGSKQTSDTDVAMFETRHLRARAQAAIAWPDITACFFSLCVVIRPSIQPS